MRPAASSSTRRCAFTSPYGTSNRITSPLRDTWTERVINVLTVESGEFSVAPTFSSFFVNRPGRPGVEW